LHWSIAVLALASGVALAFQPAINANLAARAGHPILGAFISVSVTFLALFAATLLLRQPLPGPRLLALLPPWVYVGGLIGALFLFAALVAAPRLGVATTVALLIAGQLAGALVIDHFGWLGVPQHVLTPLRLLGALCLIVGVILVRRF
jgi:bacterial/archaeal transporter family-2 protein